MRNALRLVLDGELYLPPRLFGLVNRAPGEDPPVAAGGTGLTPRQLEVLGLMAEGHPNKTIARRLDLSEHTVKLHVSAILHALEARNRTDAVQTAWRLKLIAGAPARH